MLKASKNSPYVMELGEGVHQIKFWRLKLGGGSGLFGKFGNFVTSNQRNVLLVLNFLLELTLSVVGTAYAIVYHGKFS